MRFGLKFIPVPLASLGLLLAANASMDVLNARNSTSPVRGGTTSLVFQDGLDGYQGTIDTFIQTHEPDSAEGEREYLICDTDEPDGTGQDIYTLIRFDDIFGDGPGQIPSDVGIVSATLVFEIVESGVNGGPLREILVDWDETTAYNTFGPKPGVQGSDRGGSFIGQVWTGNGNGTLFPREINVRESIERWQADPNTNKGWILQAYGGTSYGQFWSSDHVEQPLLRPKLLVEYNDSALPVLIRKPYVQMPSPTSITIMWKTDLACDSRVVVGSSPGDATFEFIDDDLVKKHSIVLADLQPDTRYYYEIGTSDDILDGGDDATYFKTAPQFDVAAPCTIWAIGDAGRNNQNQRDVRDAMLTLLGEDTPDIMLNLGDVAYNFCSEGELTLNMFDIYEDVLRHTPMLATTGSHEQYNNNVNSGLGPYFDAFSLPAGGECGGIPSGKEAYFAYEYGDIHIICLTVLASVSPTSPMVQWLNNDLSATDAAWVIAFFNHGPYSAGPHNSDTDDKMTSMREIVLPVLEGHGVDLVLSGYSHNYERSYLVDGAYDTPTTAEGHVVDSGDGRPTGDGPYQKHIGMTPHDGTVYVIAGHGAGGGSNNTHPLMWFSDSGPGSCLIQIDEGTLHFYNLQATGEVTDEFVIVKKIEPDCVGDYTSDDQVGIADLLAVISGWGNPYNVNNLLRVIAYWGPCD